MFVVGGGCMEGGQEVAGMEVCVHDKWSDRCGRQVPQCLGGRTSESPGLAESPFTLLKGKHETTSSRGIAFNPFVFAHICTPFIYSRMITEGWLQHCATV